MPALSLVVLATSYIAVLGPHLIGFVAHNWLVVLTIVCLLAATVEVRETTILRFLTHPYLQVADRINYCFYLAQLPLFFMQDAYLSNHTALPLWTIPATLVVITLIALGLHSGVERLVYKWFSKR